MSYFLTADNFRPYITSFQGNNCTDYINAVFVDVSQSNPRVTILMYYAKSNYENGSCSSQDDGSNGDAQLSVLSFHQPFVHFLSIYSLQ